MKQVGWLVILTLLTASTALSAPDGRDVAVAAAQDSSTLTMDAIRFEATGFTIDTASHTATATLTLTCLSERSRELKLNVYGTQLVDDRRKTYYFATMTMGRVLMRFEDRRNYMHYLLQPGTPVVLTITATDISPDATAIQLVKVVFEDSEDEGRFLEAYLNAPVQ